MYTPPFRSIKCVPNKQTAGKIGSNEKKCLAHKLYRNVDEAKPYQSNKQNKGTIMKVHNVICYWVTRPNGSNDIIRQLTEKFTTDQNQPKNDSAQTSRSELKAINGDAVAWTKGDDWFSYSVWLVKSSYRK